MWIKHSFFKYVTAAILILVLYYFLEKLELLEPFKTIFGTLFYPLLIAGFLFYILRPVVHLISKVRFIPVPFAILIVFVFIGGLLYMGVWLLADTVQKQMNDLSKMPEEMKQTAEEAGQKLKENDMGVISGASIQQRMTEYFGGITQQIGEHMMSVFSTIAGATTVLIIVPFVLFFFLKDGHRLIPFLKRALPEKHQPRGVKVLQDLDYTVSSYIIGQVTIAAVDGVLTYIGYLIIGIDYALILGLFVTLTCVIPFVGPVIGAIPAIVVALMQEPSLAIYVIITFIVVQQLESNLVAPFVFGERLNIHPLTVILLLVVAAPLYGVVGMIIAVPTYSVLKVLLKHGYDFYQLYHST
ncbi:AI-2E family transporter [Halobacillus karajensis]|uniref:Transport of quorum-sensing signal protein n=1 Tax=Halobacillus karajensis TaxID=195088 RepID=A0A024P533_9BACI|nr:AI-2E family transporter [Halobacillus karajensis]CDQ20541.1 Transport of quorum-sensing signal protein [Halobacillus karajensis]CDQ23990.1 Transport of quorum-sensing signal protein [Halobacillus karajensis]CDQ27468.1 Transport of quorum-sensing signal protein [Halobacillus karajensis]